MLKIKYEKTGIVNHANFTVQHEERISLEDTVKSQTVWPVKRIIVCLALFLVKVYFGLQRIIEFI